MKIIITGSLGHISKPLTQALVKGGHDVTVISSNPDRVKEIEALGATAAIGAVEDAGFLTSTFAGADAAYVMQPPNYSVPSYREYYGIVGNNYAKAIAANGVKRVVHLSSYGAHLPEGTGLILGSHDVEEILNRLDNVSVTHLRPAYFYYNLYHFVAMIKEQGVIGANYGGNDNLVMVAPADIAEAAAEELVKTTADRVRYVASDDMTASEAAKIIGAAIGKPDLQWLTFSDEQVTDIMLKNGLPPSFVADYVELGSAIHNGKLREDYDLHTPTLGKVKLQDFAKEFAAVYNK